LVCQTPFLEVVGSIKPTAYPTIHQLDTLFKGDSKKKIHAWYEFIENLETHICGQVETNGSDWFTKKRVAVKSLIKDFDNNKNIYYVRWPIDLRTNLFIDDKKKPFNASNLKERDLIKLIVEISNLWIDDDKFGLAVVVQKILVKPYQEKIHPEYIFNESDIDSASESDDNNQEINIISLLATEQKSRPSTETEINTETNSKKTRSVTDTVSRGTDVASRGTDAAPRGTDVAMRNKSETIVELVDATNNNNMCENDVATTKHFMKNNANKPQKNTRMPLFSDFHSNTGRSGKHNSFETTDKDSDIIMRFMEGYDHSSNEREDNLPELIDIPAAKNCSRRTF